MKFSNSVVTFEFAGYPMVGNLDNGYIIGLTPEGGAICAKLKKGEVPREDILEVDENLCVHLERGGFFESAGCSTAVKSAYIHVTQRCNLDCIGCYSRDEQRNTSTDPSLDQLKKAVDFLAKAGAKALVISGGEPLLRGDIDQFVRYAREECSFQQVSLITNGTILDEAILSKLVGMIDTIAVSVDGFSGDCVAHLRREQRFAQIMDTIKAIQEAGIAAHIIPTIHAKNVGDLRQYVALAKDIGVTINFSLLSCPEDDEELSGLLPSDQDLKTLAEFSLGDEKNQAVEFRDTPLGMSLGVKRMCGAGRGSLSIDSDGSVYPCHMLHDAAFRFGNIYQDESCDILAAPIRNELIEMCVDDFSGCSLCDIRYLCGGGCRARAFYSTRDIKEKDPYCELIKEHNKGIASRLG